jgi:hypothetical protein
MRGHVGSRRRRTRPATIVGGASQADLAPILIALGGRREREHGAQVGILGRARQGHARGAAKAREGHGRGGGTVGRQADGGLGAACGWALREEQREPLVTARSTTQVVTAPYRPGQHSNAAELPADHAVRRLASPDAQPPARAPRRSRRTPRSWWPRTEHIDGDAVLPELHGEVERHAAHRRLGGVVGLVRKLGRWPRQTLGTPVVGTAVGPLAPLYLGVAQNAISVRARSV